MDEINCKEYFIRSREEIRDYLQDVVSKNDFNYRTFGTEIEDYVTKKLVEIFKRGGFIKSEKDFKIASNKNEFPDFTLKCSDSHLAIEIKSGNHSKISGGSWTSCKNSNNDMGTLNVWQEKLEKFGGENIYYLFIEYNFNDTVERIVDVKVGPFYNFLGLNKQGLLRYREKDGNLRPKDFDADSPIRSFQQFQNLFSKTIIFRSKRIIIKHWNILPNTEKEILLAELRYS